MCGLRQQGLHHLAMHVRQPVVSALELERQPLVVDAQQVEQRRLQIMNVNPVRGNVVAELVGRTVAHARLHPAAGEPNREAARMVVATVIVGRQSTLAINRPPELPSPNDQRVVQKPALLQIQNQRRRRLIRIPTLPICLGRFVC